MNARENARGIGTGVVMMRVLSSVPLADRTDRAAVVLEGAATRLPGANATDAREIAKPAEPARN